MEVRQKKFNIQCNAEDMVTYINLILNGNPKENKGEHIKPAPKKFRGDYIPLLRNKAQQILELIVLANNLALTGNDSDEFTRKERLNNQRLALANCAVLDADLMSAYKVGCINGSQLETATNHTFTLAESIGKWIVGDRNRLKDEMIKSN